MAVNHVEVRATFHNGAVLYDGDVVGQKLCQLHAGYQVPGAAAPDLHRESALFSEQKMKTDDPPLLNASYFPHFRWRARRLDRAGPHWRLETGFSLVGGKNTPQQCTGPTSSGR